MRILYNFGKYIMMLRSLFTRIEKPSMYWKEILRQMNDIGVGSFGIVAIVSLFVGAVTAVQFAYNLQGSFIPFYFVGYVVRVGVIQELAPTIGCLILAGKVGSNIASELGTMRISEQIDALSIMGVKTHSYLILPKIVGALFIVPLLITIASMLGVVGGLMASTATGIVTNADFTRGMLDNFDSFDIIIMLIKSLTFAFIISSVSCYHGFYVKGGALELGKASTRAVVFSSILIILSDYIIAALLL